jgi:CheY-like chemotaxis protein
MKIVYLEDNMMDAELVRRYIETTEHELAIITSLNDIDSVSEEAIDLYLIDVMIDNDRGGLNLIRQLRRDGYNNPIVAVTALSSDADLENCRSAGCNAVLVKPYTINHLAEIIESN